MHSSQHSLRNTNGRIVWQELPLNATNVSRPSLLRRWHVDGKGCEKRSCQARLRLIKAASASSENLPADKEVIKESVLPEERTDRQKPKLWEQGWRLTKKTAQVVYANAWALVFLFALCDGATFLLHRVSHRLTNAVAMQVSGGAITSEAVGSSLWFLSNNPEVANFQTGYQWLVGLVFLITFPVGILLRTIATSTAAVICANNSGELSSPGWKPPVRRVLQQIWEAVSQVVSVSARIWQVDLLVAVRTIPLQGLSLLLIPLYLTLPRLLNLQLAQPLALFEGEHGDDAIARSARMVRPVRSALALPYVGLLLGSKLIAFVGRLLLTSISPRIAREVPEIPIVAYMTVVVASAILGRVQDMLPAVTYMSVKDKEQPGVKPSVSPA